MKSKSLFLLYFFTILFFSSCTKDEAASPSSENLENEEIIDDDSPGVEVDLTEGYHIGPGQEYEEIHDFDMWLDLEPGDVVNIHWREEPYRSFIVLDDNGTPENPIVIRGIPNNSGDLPVISGENAEIRPDFIPYLDKYGYRLMLVTSLSAFHETPDGVPGHLTIENLHFTRAHPDYSFRLNGNDENWGYKSSTGLYTSAITVVMAHAFKVSNCIFNDNAMGVETRANENFGPESITKDLRIEKSHFYDNGVLGYDRVHNIYGASLGASYEFNKIEPLKNGAPGATLKDRSSGTIVRYNQIGASLRLLDLVDAEESFQNGTRGIVASAPGYDDVYVYGNILYNISSEASGKASGTNLIHYGGDKGIPVIEKIGTLYYYNNTFYNQTNQNDNEKWSVSLFDLTSDSNDQKVILFNNIIHHLGSSEFKISTNYGEYNFEGTNWIFEGWKSRNTKTQWNNPISIINTDGGLIEGIDPGFVNPENLNCRLLENSPAIDAGTNNPTANFPVNYEYVDIAQGKAKDILGASIDLGAFEFE